MAKHMWVEANIDVREVFGSPVTKNKWLGVLIKVLKNYSITELFIGFTIKKSL